MTKKQRRTFNAEFKLQVVHMIRQQANQMQCACARGSARAQVAVLNRLGHKLKALSRLIPLTFRPLTWS